MKIHRITGTPSPEMAEALSRFEMEFRYPLGPELTFSISHGPDYSRFFRSMGDARIYFAETSGKIVGALAVVGRTVTLADGSVIPAAYICDAKVVSEYRGRTVLGRLAMTARDDTLADGYTSAYSIVMSGSTPTARHTGRIGIPEFRNIGKLAILRFDTRSPCRLPVTIPALETPNPHRIHGADASPCSKVTPVHLEAGGASGTLVDTRNGKQLWQSDGTEMISAHLINPHFTTSDDLTELIRIACLKASEMGLAGMFLSLPVNSVTTDSIDTGATLAHASVYGTGLPEGNWIVNTSEI
jgi:hypothetical protein